MDVLLNEEKYIDVYLPERIDSANHAQIQEELEKIWSENQDRTLRLWADKLEYISSAGLRVLLTLQKKNMLDSLRNVCSEVYGILDMTGFVGVVKITRSVINQSIDPDAIMGIDSYGYLYKDDDENVLRVYNDNVSKAEIQNGFELSKELIKTDISIAIPFDTIKTEKGYGCRYAVDSFETLDSFITAHPEKTVEAMEKLINEAKKLHDYEDIAKMLDKSIDRFMNMIDEKLDFNEKESESIRKAVSMLNRNNKVIFEDINETTIMYTNETPMFLDLSLLRYGNIVFELAGIYRSALEFETFFGATGNDIEMVYNKFLAMYLNTDNDEVIAKYNKVSKAFAALLSLAENTAEESHLKSKVRNIVIDYFITNSDDLCDTLDDIKTYQDSESKDENEKLVIDIRERTATKLFKKKTLLKDINMTMYPGEMVLLLGGSGAGKTTFLNAVTGYEKANATITKGDVDLYKEYETIKHRIAFAPQQDLLRNEDTVYNTLKNAAEMRLPIGTSNEKREEEIQRMLDIFGLADLKDNVIRTLSGGQRKRASIAVEFISDPVLFFLDEPDSGLDGVMAKSLMEDLRKITGKTKIIVVISHAPDRVIELFDKVIILAKSKADGAGHLAFYGSPKEAREFFKRDTMEEILKIVNRENEGGEGRADEFIEKYKNWK